MAVEITFETHSWSEDNDAGIATGWLPGRLSQRGRELAKELGERRRGGEFAAVFSSDLQRAAETARIALAQWTTSVPDLLLDWRFRECDYGEMNGSPAALVHGSVAFPNETYPGGESWRNAIERVERGLDDLFLRWNGARILIIGHMSLYWALEHRANGRSIEELGRDFTWREGWDFNLPGA